MSINFFIYLLGLNMVMYVIFRYILVLIFPFLKEDSTLSSVLSIILGLGLFLVLDFVFRIKFPELYKRIISDQRFINKIENKEQKHLLIIIIASLIIGILSVSYIPDYSNLIKENYVLEKGKSYYTYNILIQAIILITLTIKWIIFLSSLLTTIIASYLFYISKTYPSKNIPNINKALGYIVLFSASLSSLYGLTKLPESTDTILHLSIISLLTLFSVYKLYKTLTQKESILSTQENKQISPQEVDYSEILQKRSSKDKRSIDKKEEKVENVPLKNNEDYIYNDFGKIE